MVKDGDEYDRLVLLQEQIAWAERMLADTSNLGENDVIRLKAYLAAKDKELDEFSEEELGEL